MAIAVPQRTGTRRDICYVTLLVLLVMLFSANLAWLNPRPGFTPRVREFNTPPLLWQYNYDSPTELQAAAKFPDYFFGNRTRINRPVYYMGAWLCGRILTLPVRPFVEVSATHAAIIGFLAEKLLLHVLFGMLALRLLSAYLDRDTAYLALTMLLTHSFALVNMATYHTNELQYISPLCAIFFFADLCAAYSHRKNVCYALLFGTLMLAKQNYAVFVPIALTSLWQRRYAELLLGFLVHLVPLGLWLAYLNMVGLTYSNHEALAYGQGTWIIDEFIYLPPREMAATVFFFSKQLFVCLYEFCAPWICALPLLLIPRLRPKLKPAQWCFLLLLALGVWCQLFAANRPRGYMTADSALFVFALAAFCCRRMLDICTAHGRKGMVLLTALWIACNAYGILHLPWRSPWQQIGLN